eukprot:4090706-Pyramimonas_sp.AAC.1
MYIYREREGGGEGEGEGRGGTESGTLVNRSPRGSVHQPSSSTPKPRACWRSSRAAPPSPWTDGAGSRSAVELRDGTWG